MPVNGHAKETDAFQLDIMIRPTVGRSYIDKPTNLSPCLPRSFQNPGLNKTMSFYARTK
jgi:hypothetical protein